MKGNVRIFAYDVNSKIQNSPKVSLEQGFCKSGGSVLRMTVFRKFEVCASYEHLWLNRHLRKAAKRQAVKKVIFF